MVQGVRHNQKRRLVGKVFNAAAGHCSHTSYYALSNIAGTIAAQSNHESVLVLRLRANGVHSSRSEKPRSAANRILLRPPCALTSVFVACVGTRMHPISSVERPRGGVRVAWQALGYEKEVFLVLGTAVKL
jgi:hypothetical protein